MVAEQQYTSCPEPVDSLDHISVVVEPGPELESYGPEILDSNSGHRVGNITSKLLTHEGHNNDVVCLSENNNGDCEKNLSSADCQPNQDSAKHLLFNPATKAPNWET